MSKHHHQSRVEQINNKDRENILDKSNVQVSRYIDEGNPNTQEGQLETNKQKIRKPASSIFNDQQEAHEVKQAFINDESLSDVANDIYVTVEDGGITLDGQVSSNQQLNLATNTATAIGMVEKVKNRIEIIHH